jgi:hypothetical protein
MHTFKTNAGLGIAGVLEAYMPFESVVLLEMVRVPVEVAQTTPDEFWARSPHWPNVSVFAHSKSAAKAKLQYELETRMTKGESPVLPVSP